MLTLQLGTVLLLPYLVFIGCRVLSLGLCSSGVVLVNYGMMGLVSSITNNNSYYLSKKIKKKNETAGKMSKGFLLPLHNWPFVKKKN